MAAYHPLFSLRCLHEYFSGGPCAAAEFAPTPTCERLLRNADLLLRRSPDGIAVHIDPDRAHALPDRTHFDFYARWRDADFLNYTDGLGPEDGKALFFDGGRADLPDDGRLSREAYVGSADRCPSGEIPFEMPRAGTPIAFVARIAAGAGNLEPRAYYIPFRTRRTIWRYHISGQGIAGEDLLIAAPGKEDDFHYEGEMELPNGRRAARFASRAPLPLLHEQPVQYALRERHNGRLLVRRLPVPAPRLLGRENIDGEEVLTSQMFVNL